MVRERGDFIHGGWGWLEILIFIDGVKGEGGDEFGLILTALVLLHR